MEYTEFYEESGFPLNGKKVEKLKEFLKTEDLSYDEQIQATINLVDKNGDIAAACSLDSHVLKCIAVHKKYQGMGLSSRVVTLMYNYANSIGIKDLFIFSKPQNESMFSDLGFYLIMKTDDVILMENNKNGIHHFIDTLEKFESIKDNVKIGSVVVNCNPFTKGHRYLIEKASKECDYLHVFVLSEDKSEFSFDVRMRLVVEGTKDLKNVIVHKTGFYMVSSAVFPTYFIKDKASAKDMNCRLDLEVFANYFAKKLNISMRFVGTEPNCQVTNAYNVAMKKILEPYGIQVVEVERLCIHETVISASKVREFLHRGDIEGLKEFVPNSTFEYLQKEGYRYKR